MNKTQIFRVNWHSVLEGEDQKKILEEAKNLVKDCKNLSASQLRSIWDLIRELKELDEENEIKRRIAKCIIKLEYAVKRNNIPKTFYKNLSFVLNKFLEKNIEKKEIDNFVDFMEAVVAYSKK